MKNMKKLVALFAATVMAMSVSVSAFAATVETTVAPDNADIADGAFNLVFAAPEGGEADVDQLTMIAYLVPAATTLETWVAYDGTQEIVAINQVGGDVGFGSVPVDVAKLAEGKSIAVAIGGTDVGTTAKYLVTYNEETRTIAVAYVLNGGQIATDGPATFAEDTTIAAFFGELATPTKEADSEYTYEFAGWTTTSGGSAIDTASTALMSTLLEEGADSITLYALFTGTPINPGPDTITVEVVLGDINSDKTVNVTDFNQIKAYYNLTSAQKTNYKGKVGTTIGTIYLGDVNSDNTVNVTDFNQVKAYYNLTEAQRANYKGKVGTTVTTEVEAQ